jgi:hypothetical protein
VPTTFRQALLTYVLLEAGVIGATLVLAGDPFYASAGAGSLGTATVVASLLIVGLAARRRLAWTFAMFFALLGSALLTGLVALGLPGLHAKALLLLVLYTCEVVVLASPGFEPVRSNRRRVRTTPAA